MSVKVLIIIMDRSVNSEFLNPSTHLLGSIEEEPWERKSTVL